MKVHTFFLAVKFIFNKTFYVADDNGSRGILSQAGDETCMSPEGQVYHTGQSWQTTPCQSCTCRGGEIHCYSQTCPQYKCDKPLVKKGQCCPICNGKSFCHTEKNMLYQLKE